jgi:hypothetical protein
VRSLIKQTGNVVVSSAASTWTKASGGVPKIRAAADSERTLKVKVENAAVTKKGMILVRLPTNYKMTAAAAADNFKALVSGPIFTGATTTGSVLICHPNLWTGMLIITDAIAAGGAGTDIGTKLLEESYTAGTPPAGSVTMLYADDLSDPKRVEKEDIVIGYNVDAEDLTGSPA